jgi:hypothetical protein
MSNHFKYQLGKKLVDLSADTIKVILMNSSFTFNKDNHATLSDVTSSQLSTGYGYTQNDKTLTGVTLTEDDTNDRAQLTCDNISWTASGGSIGPSAAAILYDDTTSDDTVIGCIEFGSALEAGDGFDFAILGLKINLV